MTSSISIDDDGDSNVSLSQLTIKVTTAKTYVIFRIKCIILNIINIKCKKYKTIKKRFNAYLKRFLYSLFHGIYIIPGIPPPPIGGIGGVSSLISTRAHSVVKIMPATEAAFSNAIRVTFFGSIIPAFSMST
jgi:hypothetical protein